MELASHLFLFIERTLPTIWGILAAGFLYGADDIIRRFSPKMRERLDRVPEAMRRTIEIILLCLAIFYAGFSAWNEEYEKRIKVEAELIELRGRLSAGTSPLGNAILSRMPNSHKLYQDGNEIGSVSTFSYDQEEHTVILRSVTIDRTLDFSALGCVDGFNQH